MGWPDLPEHNSQAKILQRQLMKNKAKKRRINKEEEEVASRKAIKRFLEDGDHELEKSDIEDEFFP